MSLESLGAIFSVDLLVNIFGYVSTKDMLQNMPMHITMLKVILWTVVRLIRSVCRPMYRPKTFGL